MLEEKIYKLSKERFNIGSPKQLGIILFEKIGFEGGKIGKNGTYSTDVDVLETLASNGHNLPEYVLEWRQLSKLRSTYTEALQTILKQKQEGFIRHSFPLVQQLVDYLHLIQIYKISLSELRMVKKLDLLLFQIKEKS